jgi:hypothetical protein
MNYKNRSVLVYDSSGLFVSMAEVLTRSFGQVGYFRPWQDGFSDGRELLVGSGLDGIERIKYFWPVLHEWDLFVFPDCWDGDTQQHLRSIGKRVWGSGMGSDLELSRWKTRERYPELGLAQNHAEHIIGTDALRAYLKENEHKYVKVSTFRGIGETWHAQNYAMAKGQIDELDSKHGPLASILGFIVEDEIPKAKEIGYDGYYVGGFPNTAVCGVEKKDKAYFGKAVPYDSLPDDVRKTNDAVAKLLAEHEYRQFFSTEIRQKNGSSYLIDLTCRHASPAGEVYIEMFSNLADILWNGAMGILVSPEIDEPYGAQVLLCAEWAEEHYEPLEFPDEVRPYVKLYNHCRISGVDYTIPQVARMKQVGSVVALGKTPEAAVALCKQRAKQVKGYDLEAEEDALDEAVKEMGLNAL